MKLLKKIALVAALAASFSAQAVVVNAASAPEKSLQTIIDELVTSGPKPNVNTNQATEGGLFYIEAGGQNGNTLVIEQAGNANVNALYIYDPYGTNYLQLFSGTNSAGKRATLNVGEDDVTGVTSFWVGDDESAAVSFKSNVFGYYLLNEATGAKIFSDASLNGGADLFVGFQGTGASKIKLPNTPVADWITESYLFGFEDGLNGDGDFQDLVFYASNLKVPEPGSIALLGLGLAGLAAASRRKNKKA